MPFFRIRSALIGILRTVIRVLRTVIRVLRTVIRTRRRSARVRHVHGSGARLRARLCIGRAEAGR